MYFAFRCGRYNYAKDKVSKFIESGREVKIYEHLFEAFGQLLERPSEPLKESQRAGLAREFLRTTSEEERKRWNSYKVALLFVLTKQSPQSNPAVLQHLYQRVFTSVEDFVWMRLRLLHLHMPIPSQAYLSGHTLEALQSDVREMEKDLNKTGSTPLKYFQVLLATLQFERAIQYLAFKYADYFSFVVHMAIACHHFNLLQAVFLESTIGVDGWISRLVRKFILPFWTAYPKEAFQYILVFVPTPRSSAVISSTPGASVVNSIDVFSSLTEELLLECPDSIDELVGTLSSSPPLQIERGDLYFYLQHLREPEHDLAKIIVLKTAAAARNRSVAQAVQLYGLVGEFEVIAEILVKRLAELAKKNQDPERQECEKLAGELLQRAEALRNSLSMPNNRYRRALDVLWGLVNFFDLFHGGNFDPSEGVWIQLREQLKDPMSFQELMQPVQQVFPDVGLAVCEIYDRQWSYFREDSRGNHNHRVVWANFESKLRDLDSFFSTHQRILGYHGTLRERVAEFRRKIASAR